MYCTMELKADVSVEMMPIHGGDATMRRAVESVLAQYTRDWSTRWGAVREIWVDVESSRNGAR